MKPAFLLDLARNRKPAEELLAGLMPEDKNMAASLAAGQNLIQRSKEYGLSLPDYLRLAVDPSKGAFAGSGLNGFEAALSFLNLPVKDDFDHGVTLEAAAETFQTFPGTRALFPAVIDSQLQWKYRQDEIESVDPIVSQSRSVAGNEVITTVIDDKADDYSQTGVIAEGANIPVRSLRATEKNVKFYKFGGGYEFTYEFERRVSLDVITPYAARISREAEMGRVAMATNMLVNGDGVSAAAPVVTATTLAGQFPAPPTIVAGRLNWEVFLRWVMNRAKAGIPVDTVVGNYDLWFEWTRMFATPTSNQGISQMEILGKAGVQTAVDNPRFNFPTIHFAVSSTAPASKLIGFRKAETLEELTENGSEIEESIRSVGNQKVKYVRTKNHGYRLVFGDTREILHLI